MGGNMNVSFPGNRMLSPHLPELISSRVHYQIVYDKARTHRTLAALEAIAWRSSPAKQQSYVKLRELLVTMSSEEGTTSQIMWAYALIIISKFLSFAVLTSNCWQRPILTLIRRIFPWRIGQRPFINPEMQGRIRPNIAATDPATIECPWCTEDPKELVGVTTSYPAIPL
jgi:hypothetical protein